MATVIVTVVCMTATISFCRLHGLQCMHFSIRRHVMSPIFLYLYQACVMCFILLFCNNIKSWSRERCILLTVSIILLSRVIRGQFMLNMVGLFYMSTMLNIPYFARVEFIVSYVSRCITLLFFVHCRCNCLICCLVVIYVVYHGFRVETSLVIIVRSSISSFQLVIFLLMRRCTSGVRGINASVRGRELVTMYFIHSVVVSASRLANC